MIVRSSGELAACVHPTGKEGCKETLRVWIAAKSRVRIVRIVDGKEQVLEKVSLQEELQPGDVIVVPESYF